MTRGVACPTVDWADMSSFCEALLRSLNGNSLTVATIEPAVWTYEAKAVLNTKTSIDLGLAESAKLYTQMHIDRYTRSSGPKGKERAARGLNDIASACGSAWRRSTAA